MQYHEHITEVYKRICPYIRKTPVLNSLHYSNETNSTIFFKCENLQYTNAFKTRGAFSKITNKLDKNKIIITCSAGNHGMGVANAAKTFGMHAVIVMPEFAPQFRIDRIKALGADVIVHGNTMDELNAKVAEYLSDARYVYIHGFDDEDVIAGQATIAYELLQDIPDIDIIVVPVGGGGLISGIAQYAKSINPNIKIYGVETIGTDSMSQSLHAGKIIALQKITSIAVSLGASKVSERTFANVKKYVETVVTVSDAEAVRELKGILANDKLLVEPASSCALAAITSGKITDIENKKIAVILSGGNFSLDELKIYL